MTRLFFNPFTGRFFTLIARRKPRKAPAGAQVEKLRGIARSAAARAKRQHSKVSLPPMNAYERRLIHLALVDDDEVTTHSEGEDPTRHVVITALRA